MLKKLMITKKITIAVLMIGLYAIGCHFTQETVPTDAGGNCATGPQALTPTEFNTWFESGAASLNGAVLPANSVTFPNIPNCSFYKWSQQMFLWLTSPAPPRYGSGGLVMNTPAFYDVSPPDGSGKRHFIPHFSGLIRTFNLRTPQRGALDLTVILEKRSLRLLEILPPVLSTSRKQLIMNKDGNEMEIGSVRVDNNQRPILFDVSGKEIQGPRAIIQSLKDTAMSPITKRIKKIENFDKTSLVQNIILDKSIFIDLFGDFHEVEQGQAFGEVLMAQNHSLVYYSITVNTVFALFRTMQGAIVPSGTKFPTTQANLDAISTFAIANGRSPIIDPNALAIEIKCSWIEAAGLPEAERFIKMMAEVPTYDKTTDPNDWAPTGTQTIELAMVGMHVVGSTQGHSELLWATFEHVSSDPVAAYTYTTTSGTNTNVPQNTAGVWVFSSNGATSPFNVSNMFMDGDHIKALSGHTISPSNILREMPWGLNGSSSNQNAEVISINHIARSLLNPADVRINYIQTGTTWTILGASPTSFNQVGTNKLANTTMETFTQGTNCFMCHQTNTTVVSHIFDDTEPLF